MRAKLAQRTHAPGQAAKAHQLAAQLDQIVGDMPQLPGTGPEKARVPTSVLRWGKARPLDLDRHDADVHIILPSGSGTDGRLGGQGVEDGEDSDVEVLDAPPSDVDWGRKREASLKRRCVAQSGDAKTKRVIPRAEAVEQGTEAKGSCKEPEMEALSERQNRMEEKGSEDQSGHVGNGVVPQGDGQACPTSTPDLFELCVAMKKLVTGTASGATLTQADVVEELERRGICTDDEDLVTTAFRMVRNWARREARWDSAAYIDGSRSGKRPLQGLGKPKGTGERSVTHMTNTVVAVQIPPTGGAKAETGEANNANVESKDTAREAADGELQTAQARSKDDSTGELTTAPASEQDTTEMKVVGLGFKRKRHGAAPKRSRLEPMQHVHVNWNINGEDEAASALLKTLSCQNKESASLAAGVGRAWNKTSISIAPVETIEGLEPLSGALEINQAKAQTRAIKHRKQDCPRRLV